MKSPKDMRIILIDVTNACVRQCSNCTRFCGHHKKPFFMDYETFCRAVDSLDGYVGTVGIIGGESTLHPDFERMTKYLASHRPPKEDFSLYAPQRHFMDSVHDVEMSHTFLYPCGDKKRVTVNGGGTWSVMGDSYKKHYEIIQDTAKYQALNDHSNPMYHKPALISRKELGISDEEWPAIRDNCWVVDVWSANITPKGAFFCEVAGCLDMLFDGSGGWKIEPGWWMRTPEEFGDQLKWCEMCGMACETFTRDANEEIDDVSPLLYERLKAIGSRKVAQGKVNVVKINNGVIDEKSKAAGKTFGGDMPYVESYNARFNESKTSLFYKEYVGIFICEKRSEIDSVMTSVANSSFKKKGVLVSDSIWEEFCKLIPENEDTIVFNSSHTGFGEVIYKMMYGQNHNTYALVLCGNIQMTHVIERLNLLVCNPGTLLYREYKQAEEDDYFQAQEDACAMLFNGIALSIREAGWDRILRSEKLEDIRALWQKRKVLLFAPETEQTAPTANIETGKRYVIYGAGKMAGEAAEKIRNGGGQIVTFVDGNPCRQKQEMCGYIIESPSFLIEHKETYDRIMIGTGLYYLEVKNKLIEMGFSTSIMAWI